MKKNGFTLAEVLITLAIIGVVATLTLPALMSNTQEQQAITGFRKAMNTLNEVAQMNAAVDGFDFSGVTSGGSATTDSVYDDNGMIDQTVWAMMVTKAQVDSSASVTGGIGAGCNQKTQVFFRDGTVLCYGEPSGGQIEAYVDTNGRKGPNKVSTCSTEACKPAERSIGDQFVITLTGANAIPGRVVQQKKSAPEGDQTPDTGDTAGAVDSGTESKDDTESYASRWAMLK